MIKIWWLLLIVPLSIFFGMFIEAWIVKTSFDEVMAENEKKYASNLSKGVN